LPFGHNIKVETYHELQKNCDQYEKSGKFRGGTILCESQKSKS